jgi:hypothetical protein
VIGPFERRALRPLTELGLDDDTPLFVLTMPEGNVEVRETHQNELVVWAYTRLAPMLTCCGNGQPFVRVTARELRTVSEALDRFVYVAVDLLHPDGVRYPEPDWRDLEHLPLIDTTVPDTSLLWVPIRASTVGATKAMVEMVADEQGEPRLLVYTSLETLRARLGTHRAAVSFRAEVLDRLIRDVGARSVVFDATVAEQNTDLSKEDSPWASAMTRRR